MGRNIMLGWLQELRKGAGFDYAGCISLPRVLSYKGKLVTLPLVTRSTHSPVARYQCNTVMKHAACMLLPRD